MNTRRGGLIRTLSVSGIQLLYAVTLLEKLWLARLTFRISMTQAHNFKNLFKFFLLSLHNWNLLKMLFSGYFLGVGMRSKSWI